MLSDIQAVLLDLGDTLTRTKIEIVEKICAAIGTLRKTPLTTTAYLTAFHNEWSKRQKPLDEALIRSVTSPEDEIEYWENFFNALLANLQVPVNEQKRLAKTCAKIYSDPNSFECFEDTYEVLRALKATGLKLGIISNAFPSAKAIIHRLDLGKYFDYIALSYDIEPGDTPYIKPEPQIYHRAVERLNVAIDKCVFVDDRWNFVKGAIELGMDGYLIDRISPLKKELKTKSLVQKITSLYELTDLILGYKPNPPQYSLRSTGTKRETAAVLPHMNMAASV